jgi:hypothetical protein
VPKKTKRLRKKNIEEIEPELEGDSQEIAGPNYD